MSLASSARQALGRFTHLTRPASAKSTPAKADDKDEKASDDDKDKEKAEDDKEEASDDDDKEKADDGDKDKNPVDEKAADDDEDDDEKKKKKDDDKDAKKAARSATVAERDRWTKVLSHKHSAGRIEAACELLSDKSANHTAESVIRILGSLPAVMAGKTGGLGERMSTVSTPKVGADTSAAPDPTTPAGLAAQITATYNKARGIKPAA